MSGWHYLDKNGEKVGPIKPAVLKELAQKGLVTPETQVIDPQGRSNVAGKVKGLTFPATPPIPSKPPAGPAIMPKENVHVAPPATGDVYGFAVQESPPMPFAEPKPFSAPAPAEINPFVNSPNPAKRSAASKSNLKRTMVHVVADALLLLPIGIGLVLFTRVLSLLILKQ